MKNKKKIYLEENIKLLKISVETLKKSVIKCRNIGIKENYSFEELESFDSLTSKFARTSDIFIQKVLRSVFNILREPQLTLIDMSNRAEKLELISSADDLLEIRDIRNEITHEYIQEILFEIFENVLNKTEILFNSIEKTIFYIKNKKLCLL